MLNAKKRKKSNCLIEGKYDKGVILLVADGG